MRQARVENELRHYAPDRHTLLGGRALRGVVVELVHVLFPLLCCIGRGHGHRSISMPHYLSRLARKMQAKPAWFTTCWTSLHSFIGICALLAGVHSEFLNKDVYKFAHIMRDSALVWALLYSPSKLRNATSICKSICYAVVVKVVQGLLLRRRQTITRYWRPVREPVKYIRYGRGRGCRKFKGLARTPKFVAASLS